MHLQALSTVTWHGRLCPCRQRGLPEACHNVFPQLVGELLHLQVAGIGGTNHGSRCILLRPTSQSQRGRFGDASSEQVDQAKTTTKCPTVVDLSWLTLAGAMALAALIPTARKLGGTLDCAASPGAARRNFPVFLESFNWA